MTKIGFLFEYSEGKYKILYKHPTGYEVKLSKKQMVRLTKNKTFNRDKYVNLQHDKTGNKIEPIYLDIKTNLGKATGLPLYTTIPFFKCSYKCNHVVPWGEVVTGNFDMETYKQMREEDAISEILKTSIDWKDSMLIIIISVALGFFAGYFIFSGGLSSII